MYSSPQFTQFRKIEMREGMENRTVQRQLTQSIDKQVRSRSSSIRTIGDDRYDTWMKA